MLKDVTVKQWLYLFLTIFIFIVFLVIYIMWVLIPTNSALSIANNSLDNADQLIKTISAGIVQTSSQGVVIPDKSVQYLKSILGSR